MRLPGCTRKSSADYNDMIYAASKPEIEVKRKAFICKWRVKCRAVAESLEEAGDKLFTFTRFPKSQLKSIRTSNAIERLHEEFKRRINTQSVLPSAETAAMLFWALMASGQITMRKVDGWHSLNETSFDQMIDLAASWVFRHPGDRANIGVRADDVGRKLACIRNGNEMREPGDGDECPQKSKLLTCSHAENP